MSVKNAVGRTDTLVLCLSVAVVGTPSSNSRAVSGKLKRTQWTHVPRGASGSAIRGWPLQESGGASASLMPAFDVSSNAKETEEADHAREPRQPRQAEQSLEAGTEAEESQAAKKPKEAKPAERAEASVPLGERRVVRCRHVFTPSLRIIVE